MSRYRMDGGEATVDVRLAGVEHLFDNRDPAPFRERDLDPDLVDYLIDASEDLRGSPRFRIVFWLEKPCQPGEIEGAYRAHFEYEIERLTRERRRQRRTGLVALAIATAGLLILFALAEGVGRLVGGSLGGGLRQVIEISGWVLMWRPVEVLLYDGIPARRRRHLVQRLLDMSLEVRQGKGPG